MGQYFRAVFLAEDSDEVTGYLKPGDYSGFRKITEHGWIGDRFVDVVEQMLTEPKRVVWAGDYADSEPGPGEHGNLYNRARSAAAMPEPETRPVGRYVINHDKRRYVDKTIVRADDFGCQVHPLVALTAEGYGLRSGEFGDDPLIGTWARDHISVADCISEGFGELDLPILHF